VVSSSLGISLGVEDGFAIMEKLRVEGSNIPVIILSSDKKRSTIIKGVMSGAADYILMTLLESDHNIGFEEADKIFIELKKLFWETDLFIRFGLKSFVGVFPFADEEQVLIIDKKIKNFYINSELGKKYSINLENVFVTFPRDGTTVEELIKKLQSKRE
jgi:CheY-like chemotaxis protein